MAMNRTYVDGKRVNVRTANMLKRAEQRLGHNLRVIQGSYNAGRVGASAGTHDGGGALDISTNGLSEKTKFEAVKQLRMVGFAAWLRRASEGPWTEHIHAIAIGDPELSSGAQHQVNEYYAGRNGLANRRSDPHWRPSPIRKWPVPMPAISEGRLQYQYRATKKRSVPAVKKIQYLMNYRMGTDLKVDGIFGNQTKAAYKRWEDRVNAPVSDGIPGRYSLYELVKGFYRIVK